MALRRYNRTDTIGINRQYGTSFAIQSIREGIRNGTIRFEQDILRENQRLDSIAGEVYGDATLFWAIAAASDIGWALQAPPGTLLKIPEIADLEDILG